MKKITVTIKFKNTTGGNVTTQIMGPNTNITYLANAAHYPRSFDLEPGNYSIILNGISGGTCALSVDDIGNNNLTSDTCGPKHIYIASVFMV
jgi:hypothetical protein